jgi:hypothetical protein
MGSEDQLVESAVRTVESVARSCAANLRPIKYDGIADEHSAGAINSGASLAKIRCFRRSAPDDDYVHGHTTHGGAQLSLLVLC